MPSFPLHQHAADARACSGGSDPPSLDRAGWKMKRHRARVAHPCRWPSRVPDSESPSSRTGRVQPCRSSRLDRTSLLKPCSRRRRSPTRDSRPVGRRELLRGSRAAGSRGRSSSRSRVALRFGCHSPCSTSRHGSNLRCVLNAATMRSSPAGAAHVVVGVGHYLRRPQRAPALRAMSSPDVLAR